MVDRDGAESFSMRGLAEELRVTTMAVYYHFENKAEVLQAAADQAWIEVVESVPSADDPVERLIQGFLTTRRVFDRHSDIALYAIASPTTEDAVHVMALGLSDVFAAAGLHGRLGADAYFALTTYTLGSALLHARRRALDRAIRQPVSDLAQGAAAPVFGADHDETYRLIREAMGQDDDLERFEAGLRQIAAAYLARRDHSDRAEPGP
jgi:AcrR family transcriptional regulator